MNYFLDAAAAAAVIICVLVGRHRGAVRTLIFIVGYAAAFGAAVFVSGAAAGYVYDNVVKPAVVSAVESKSEELAEEYLSAESLGRLLNENGVVVTEEQLKNTEILSELLTKEEFRGTLNHIFIEYCGALTEAFSGVAPHEITEEAERYIENAAVGGAERAEFFETGKENIAAIVEREIIRPVMLKTVKTVLFGVTFAAVMLAAAIAAKAVGLIRKIEAVRRTDGFLGGVLGFFQGLLVIVIICAAVEIFIKLTSDGSGVLNSAVISETVIFKRLYGGVFLLLGLIIK